MAKTVEETALATEVLAGEDIRNGVKMGVRQPRGVSGGSNTDALQRDIDGMRIGLLEERFDWDASHPEVDTIVRDVVDELEAEGADVCTDRIYYIMRNGSLLERGISTHRLS